MNKDLGFNDWATYQNNALLKIEKELAEQLWAKLYEQAFATPTLAEAPPKRPAIQFELWWQKEARFAKEKHAGVVALRNDVRKILGM